MKYISLILTFSMFLISCGKKDHSHDTANGGHAHGESHEEGEKIFITAYNADFEVFAEADAFVAGKKSRILSHFSYLTNFKALESVKMTARLIIAGKETSQTLDKPTRKGIYDFALTPKVAGKGKLLYIIESEKGKSIIKAENIEVFKTAKEANESAHNATPSMTNAVVFTKEQSWKVDFGTRFPKLIPFGQVIKTSAKIESSPSDEIIISAQTNGILMFTSENLVSGAKVQRGNTVFSVSGNGLAKDNSAVRFNEAKNNYFSEKEHYERLQSLLEDKLVSETEVHKVKKEFENAKFVYESLKKNFSSKGEKAKSSMSGFVKQIFAQNGQYVEAGQAILSISQNKTLFIRADVQQKYAKILPLISDVNIVTFNNSASYNFKELNGKILSVGKTTNTDNFLLPVSLQIDNNGSFFSGEFVQIYLKTVSSQKAITVPNSALIEDQGVFFVFSQIHPELFEKKEVKIGGTDGSRTEITQGITNDSRIVTEGTILVKLAQASGALDPHAGHVH